jgi:hypothetical protein
MIFGIIGLRTIGLTQLRRRVGTCILWAVSGPLLVWSRSSIVRGAPRN